MEKEAKNIIKKFVPPLFIDVYSKLTKINIKPKYGWFGNYSSWEEASLLCEGYDSKIILEKVKSALLKVKNCEAVYERDSVLFDHIQYSWALLATLLKIGVENGKLHIVDFGGSLGSSYFQNKDFLAVIDDIQWNIVEQSHFVDVGKAEFEDDHLKFYYSIDECLEQIQCDVLLLSSVLQYLESPFSYIEQILMNNFKYIIIDRTAFTLSVQSFITVQRVPPEIYSASYPCWFFNEDSLLDIFQKKYDLQYSFNALDSSNLPNTYFKGFVFKRKLC